MNNPVKYIDPTGHVAEGACGFGYGDCVKPKYKKPPIVPREDWNAHEPGSYGNQDDPENSEGLYDPETNQSGYKAYDDLAKDLDTIVIHHEGDHEKFDILEIQKYHMDNRSYYDIGYHFIIGPDGVIYEGRNLGVRGAHVAGANSGKIGILWLGDFNPGVDTNHEAIDPTAPRPTTEQYGATIDLVQWLDQEYGIDTVAGHRDYNSTICPGSNAMPYVEQLNLLVQ